MGAAMLQTLLLLSGIIGLASAVIVLPGLCVVYPPYSSFQIEQLYGFWYTIERFAMNYDQDHGPRCTYTEFASDGAGGYDMTSTSYYRRIKRGKFHPITKKAHIQPLNSAVPADMQITILQDDSPWPMSAHFVVLYASASFAVVGGCNDLLNQQNIQYLQIISKTSTLSSSTVDRVKELLHDDYNIPSEYLVPEIQTASECEAPIEMAQPVE